MRNFIGLKKLSILAGSQQIWSPFGLVPTSKFPEKRIQIDFIVKIYF